MIDILQKIRIPIVRIQKIIFFKRFLSPAQKAISWLFVYYLSQYRQIKAIYVSGSLSKGDFVFGESDIDTIAFLHPLTREEEFITVSRIYLGVARFAKIFRIVKLETLFSESDKRLIKKLGRKLFFANPLTWRHLFGEIIDMDFLINRLPPEAARARFLQAVLNYPLLISSYMETSQLANTSLRDFYKAVYKICHILTDAKALQDNQDVFHSGQPLFFDKISDVFLMRICEKSESLLVRDFFSKEAEDEIAEASARLLKWLDNIAQSMLSTAYLNTEIFSKHKTAASREIPQPFIKYANAINQELKGYLNSIIYFKGYLYIIVRETNSIAELKAIFITAKRLFLKSQLKNLPQETIRFWTQSVLKILFSYDHFWQQSYLVSAQIIHGTTPTLSFKMGTTEDNYLRRLYVLNAMVKMKKVFMLRGVALLIQQKCLLRELALNRILLGKNVVPNTNEVMQEYKRCFSEESATDRIISLLAKDVSNSRLTRNMQRDLSRDFYLSQCYLLERTES